MIRFNWITEIRLDYMRLVCIKCDLIVLDCVKWIRLDWNRQIIQTNTRYFGWIGLQQKLNIYKSAPLKRLQPSLLKCSIQFQFNSIQFFY